MAKKKAEAQARGELPAEGDNSDVHLAAYIDDVLSLEKEILQRRDEIKDILANAKGDGFKKMAIRGAVKDLLKSEEARQAAKETRRTIEDYYTIYTKQSDMFDEAA